jgi:hypothetical protein
MPPEILSGGLAPLLWLPEPEMSPPLLAIAERPPSPATVPHLPQNDAPFSEDPHATGCWG